MPEQPQGRPGVEHAADEGAEAVGDPDTVPHAPRSAPAEQRRGLIILAVRAHLRAPSRRTPLTYGTEITSVPPATSVRRASARMASGPAGSCSTTPSET